MNRKMSLIPTSLLIVLTLSGCGALSLRQNETGFKKNPLPEVQQETKPIGETLINKKEIWTEKNTAIEVHEDAKPGWKTLTDKENGYSFAYPKNWILDDTIWVNERQEKIITPFGLTNQIYSGNYLKEGDISFKLNIFESTLSLKEWFEKNGDFSKADIEKNKARIKECCEKNVEEKDFEAKIQEIAKDGTIGIVSYGKIPVLEEGLPPTSKAYHFQKGGRIYKFRFITPTGAKDKELIKIFDEVMDSLKFIE